MLGLLGLPHILMRFYTVPDARAARTSVLYATGFIGYFYLIIPIVGFGASALVGRDIIAKVDAGGNMAAPLVAELLGGTPFLGFIAAVAFATILAVVAGLTLAGASALSHDIFVHVVRRGHAPEHEQIRVARVATVVFGVAGRPPRHRLQGPERRVHGRPGVRDRRQRQLSAVAPVDRVEAVHDRWRRLLDRHRRRCCRCCSSCSARRSGSTSCTTRRPIFPLRNPAIVSMPAAFLVGIVASLIAREPTAEAMFDDEKLRTYLGVGAE